MRTIPSHFRQTRAAWPALVGLWLLSHATWAQDGATRNAVIPPAPMLVSRVEPFRKLLAADGVEREKLLASRPEPQREQFRKALRDYDALKPAEREHRLQTLELRFQLTYLIPLPPEVRTQVMARLPASSQKVIHDRLGYWNGLSPDQQRVLSVNERLMRDFVVRICTIERPPLPGGVASSNLLVRINQAATSWNSLPESKRTAVEQALQRMIESGSIDVATGVLSTGELEDMRRVLERFQLLSPPVRSSILRNSEKLMELSAEERQVFLQSAEAWQKMSPADREAWKTLVKRAPVLPPNPPGLGMPRRLPEPTRLFGTNGPPPE